MANDDSILKAQAFTSHIKTGVHHLDSAAFLVQGDARNKYLRMVKKFESFIEDLSDEDFTTEGNTDSDKDTTDTQPGA